MYAPTCICMRVCTSMHVYECWCVHMLHFVGLYVTHRRANMYRWKWLYIHICMLICVCMVDYTQFGLLVWCSVLFADDTAKWLWITVWLSNACISLHLCHLFTNQLHETNTDLNPTARKFALEICAKRIVKLFFVRIDITLTLSFHVRLSLAPITLRAELIRATHAKHETYLMAYHPLDVL